MADFTVIQPEKLAEMSMLSMIRSELDSYARVGDVQRFLSTIRRNSNLFPFDELINFTQASVPPPLLTACRQGHLEFIRILFNKYKIRVQVNFHYLKDTPLSAAAERGYVEIMELLFEHGAEPDFAGADSFGNSWSPLMNVAHNGHYEAAVLLLEKGAEVNAYFRTRDDQTPLKLAARNGHDKLVKLLLDNGAAIHSKHHSMCENPSALAHACEEGQTKCVRQLLKPA